jgi:hypothetical protein
VIWTQGAQRGQLPLGRVFRNLLLGTDVSPALRAEAGASPLYAQYDPRRPGALARPEALPSTDLRPAF